MCFWVVLFGFVVLLFFSLRGGIGVSGFEAFLLLVDVFVYMWKM